MYLVVNELEYMLETTSVNTSDLSSWVHARYLDPTTPGVLAGC